MLRKFTNYNRHPSHGVDHDTYKGENDLVGRFRLYENVEHVSREDAVLNHLAMYAKDPLTKPELVDQMMKNISKQVDLGEVFRVKRSGKDADDFFWQFGKIHGLENIAFADPAEVAACSGNPVALQQLVNKAKYQVNTPKISSYDQLKDDASQALLNYRDVVDKLPLQPSDRKKLLAMPFAMAKRAELPIPRRGQSEYELFTELTGQDWHSDAQVRDDKEVKITEFDYENYLSPALLKNVETDSAEFKDLVKMLNYSTKTQYEGLQD